MAMKLDKESLKKHHFWWLFIPYLLCAGLILAGILMFVDDATSERIEKLAAHGNELKGIKTESAALEGELKKQTDGLKKRRGEVWKASWEEQKALFTWPNRFNQLLAKAQALRFGDDIPDDVARAFDDDRYRGEYNDLATRILPMQFQGDWAAVLKTIPRIDRKPTSEDIWLALEGLWVQREVVLAAHQVNLDAARFEPDPAHENTALHAWFKSRIWELEMWVEQKQNTSVLYGKVRNRTNRVQPLGLGNRMYLRVWLDEATKGKADGNWVDFPVEGESVPAETLREVKTVKEHTLIDQSIEKLALVQQVFDSRTVPVKQVDALKLGYHSARTAASPLKMTRFSEKLSAPAEGTEAPKTAATTAPAGATSFSKGGSTSGSGAADAAEQSFFGLDRKRYIDVTDQVRRMPLGVSVVIDQTYMNDFMTALANSKLRFQTTQSHWTRFHGSIRDILAPGTAAAAPPKTGDEAPAPKAAAPMPTGSIPKGMSMPTGMAKSAPLPGATAGTTSGSDQTSGQNLVEMTVYGIISLYEKYEAAPAEGTK